MLDLYKVGTIAKIKQVVKLPKHVLRILVEGLERAELLGFVNDDAFLETEVACYEKSESIPVSDNAKEAMLRNLKEIFLTFCQENQKISSELATQILEMEDMEKMVDQIAINLPLPYEQRQKLLEAVTLAERYELLGILMTNEIEIMQIRGELQERSRNGLTKPERVYSAGTAEADTRGTR